MNHQNQKKFKLSSPKRSTTVNWFPGHMKKTSDLIKKLVGKVQAVIEILDARIPSSSCNPLITQYTASLPRLIILNKIDLADTKVTALWEKYFHRKGFAVLSLQANRGNEKKIRDQMKKKIREIFHHSLTFTAMICGVPNVGKSTLINLISGERKTQVGDRPGITRDKQLIKINSQQPWALLDMPGLLMPKLNDRESLHLSLCGNLKDDIFDEVELACNFIRIFSTQTTDGLKKLIRHFDLPYSSKEPIEEIDQEELFWLQEIAKRRGYLLKDQEINYTMSAKTLLRDFRNGKLGRLSLETPEPIINDKNG